MMRTITHEQLRQSRKEKKDKQVLRRLKAVALVLALFAGVLTWQNMQGRSQDTELRMLSRRISAVEQRTQYLQSRVDPDRQQEQVFYDL